MRKFIMGCLGVVAALVVAQFALAEVKAGVFSDCSPCDAVACDPCEAACGKESLWKVGGWIESGIYVNEYDQRNAYFPANGENNFRPFSGNTDLLNNVRQSDFQVNQAWLFLEKKLAKHGVDVGGRVDMMYGTDGRYLQSAGLEMETGHGRPWGQGDYGVAVAQAYLEVGNREFSVKAGKFVTPMGQESIMSPNRFFYSLSYAFAATPVNHSGIMATWNPSKDFSVYGGWVNGEAQTFDTSDDNALLAGIEWALSKRVKLGYSVLIGQQKDVLGVANRDRDYLVQTVVADVKLSKRWDYSVAWTLRNEDTSGVVPFHRHAGAYGINNELIYRLNSRWAVGARAEWMHNYGIVRDSDSYEFTLGANWTPAKWLLVRPEVRYDKYDGQFGFGPFDRMDGGNKDDQLSAGVSAVVKF